MSLVLALCLRYTSRNITIQGKKLTNRPNFTTFTPISSLSPFTSQNTSRWSFQTRFIHDQTLPPASGAKSNTEPVGNAAQSETPSPETGVRKTGAIRRQTDAAYAKLVEKLLVKVKDNKPIKVPQTMKSIAPLKENIYTIPNLLTGTRILTSPVIGYLLCTHQTVWAMGFFVYSCVTDFVDGYLARRYNMGSVLGSIMDPMADKLLMTVCTVSLWFNQSMPLLLASVIIGRDVMLLFMAIYYRYISLPPPKTFTRFWDFLIPSAEVHPTRLSKWNTGFQMIYIGTLVLRPGIEHLLAPDSVESFGLFIELFGYFVASTTVLLGASYVFSNKAVKILKH